MRRRSPFTHVSPFRKSGRRPGLFSPLSTPTASAARAPTIWRKRSAFRGGAHCSETRAPVGRDPEQPRPCLCRRIRGDHADNLEKAIAAYEAALTVRTREALPHEWAETQNNLAARLCDPHPRRCAPTTWRRRLPPTRRRSRSGRARPCRASGRRRRTTLRIAYAAPHPRRAGRQPGEGDRRTTRRR